LKKKKKKTFILVGPSNDNPKTPSFPVLLISRTSYTVRIIEFRQHKYLIKISKTR